MLIMRHDVVDPRLALALEAEEIGGARFYAPPAADLHDLAPVPSVTTVLGASKLGRDRLGLERWRERVGAEEAAAHTARRCEEGTAFHAEVEALLCDPFSDLSAPPPGSPFLESVRGFLGLIEDVVAVELPVFSEEGFAGTLDLLAFVRGRGLCLIDWKSTLYRKKEEWIADYLIQISAYAAALDEQYGVRPDAGCVVLAEPGVPAAIRFIESTELELGYAEFVIRLAESRRARK